MAVLFSILEMMCDVRTVLLGVVTFLILAWLVHSYVYRVPNLPPGPRSWPIVGCMPHLIGLRRRYKENQSELFKSLHKEYGPVCYLALPFGTKMVMFSGHEAVIESLNFPGIGEDRPVFPQDNPEEMLNGRGRFCFCFSC